MSLGKRVKETRKKLEYTQVKLSELSGITQQTIQKIEDGTTKNPRNIEALATALQCTPEYLRFGISDNINSNVAPGPTLKAAVPLISWVQAGAWSDINEIRECDADRYLCPVKCSDKTFALKVQGVSMEPKFYDGDLIFVDPEAECIHGSYVVARLDDDNQATFKQLIIESGHKFLKAANPNWPEQLIPINGNCTLVGKVVFAGKSF
ncbi:MULTISPECIES: XRE family transcriptional regulator [Pseudoalteromonas]|uniref:LexA family protein n=1 Tax=Pseudoalteromonas TaxID=53246 RepID=UPI0002CC577B|nr:MULTISPECIES: XRE family transcriptional regulator [Pseudoalteromonas]ENN97508.1 XRE family transcriptional regulator [Pseudoalteromonas agarivorans S816]TMS64194.1 helix-turn-helix domain-containing protein [Pseudoalteromonas sp. S1691]TMS68225.1 helix-turn-helix domain-containing protein [Pseudoalteromonas sp. S1941]TMS68340.1 helix-turn-helix domain-containing protein [Pseudoalteromonas sp. S1731]TMS76034.1 helix-turn-helix domain-containing protein [Pseudoalteromonas sp. S1690]